MDDEAEDNPDQDHDEEAQPTEEEAKQERGGGTQPRWPAVTSRCAAAAGAKEEVGAELWSFMDGLPRFLEAVAVSHTLLTWCSYVPCMHHAVCLAISSLEKSI